MRRICISRSHGKLIAIERRLDLDKCKIAGCLLIINLDVLVPVDRIGKIVGNEATKILDLGNDGHSDSYLALLATNHAETFREATLVMVVTVHVLAVFGWGAITPPRVKPR